MSKYKVGDKIVLEIISGESYGDYLAGSKEQNWWLYAEGLERGSEPLGTYTEPLEAKIRRQAAEITRLLRENAELKEESKRNYTINIEMARAEGHSEAWELARKITCQPINGGFNRSEFEEIFDEGYISDIFEKYTYSEAAAKVVEWEKATIKRGDEVEKNDLRDARFIVTFTNGRLMSGVTQSGLVFSNEKTKDWHKTGRHIDVDSFLKQIGEE